MTTTATNPTSRLIIQLSGETCSANANDPNTERKEEKGKAERKETKRMKKRESSETNANAGRKWGSIGPS